MRFKRGARNIPTASGIYLILFGFYFTIGAMGMEHDGQTYEVKIGPFQDLATCQQVLKDYEHNYFVIEGCKEGL